MIPFFYFLAIWFVGDENNRNLNNLFQKLFCSPSKVPISTRIIPRNTSKRSRMFYQLLFAQNVQISIIFLSVNSIVIKIKISINNCNDWNSKDLYVGNQWFFLTLHKHIKKISRWPIFSLAYNNLRL